MSAGDAREGIIRGKAARARLGGKLAGLSLPRHIAVIAFWPFLEQLLSFFVTSSDLFIATKIGVNAQDTINISDGMGAVVFIMWFGFVIQGSIMMGATAIVSRMTGARDYPQAQHGLHQAAMLGLLAGTISCGLLFTCSDFLVTHVLTMNETARAYALQYVYMAAFAAPFSGVVFAINAALRGSGDTRLPFWIMMSVGILNVIFSVIFVFADAPLGGWRIEGIAAGTVCGYGISMCILLFIMLRRRKKIFTGRKNESLEELVRERGEHYAPPLYLSFSQLRPDMGMQKRILKIGLPQAVEVFGMWGIQMFCLSIISELPIKGVLGVHNIAVRIESLSFLPGFAIGMAASTLVGQYLGARNALMARITIWKCMRYAVIFMTGLGVLFSAFPALFMEIFSNGSTTLIDTGIPVLRTMLVVEPFFAACIVMKMSLRGAGDTRRVMLISYGIMGFFRVVCTWIWFRLAPETMTLWGIWLVFAFEMAVQSAILYKIVKGRSWTKLQV